MLKLIEFNNKYLDQYKEAYLLTKELVDNNKLDERLISFSNPDEVDVIQKAKDSADITKLKPNHVLSYKFMAIEDDKFIGIISIREHLNEELSKKYGHIGYAINPKYWNNGYGKEMLKIALRDYKGLIKDDIILITCDDDNIK